MATDENPMFFFVKRLEKTYEDVDSVLKDNDHNDEITKRGVAVFKLNSELTTSVTQETKDNLARQMQHPQEE